MNKLSCAQWCEHLFPNESVFNATRDLAKFSLHDHFYLFARLLLPFSYIHLPTLTPQSHHHHHNLSSVFSTNLSTYGLFILMLLLLTTCSDLIVCMHILGSIGSLSHVLLDSYFTFVPWSSFFFNCAGFS